MINMDKIYIITIVNKHEDLIRLQHQSIINHIKGNYEYIVFNNASTTEQEDLNRVVCEELGIKCISIKVNYKMGPSHIAGAALNEAFNQLSDKLVFKIDSDMFFTSTINLFDICSKNDLFYIETTNEFMWSGVFGVNMSKIKDIKLDFSPGVGGYGDTFSQSRLLTNRPNLTKKKMVLYCILNEIGNKITGTINNDCTITLTDYKLTSSENSRYDYLHNGISSKYSEISKKMVDYNFPKPYHIDMITIDGVDSILHFKSSNHDDIYRDLEYTKNKKKAITNFLKNN